MRQALVFGWHRAWIALAVSCLFAGCVDGAVEKSEEKCAEPLKSALWSAAWQCAASVSSPIDAGRTKIALAEKAAQAGGSRYLETAVESDREAWVRGAGLALEAVSAALDGDMPCAEQKMKDAQACEKRVNEWRLPILQAEVRKGEGALILTEKAAGGANVTMLREWTEAAPADRTGAAAWVCAEWVARKGRTISEDGPVRTVILAALDYAAKLYPWDRFAVLVRVAPQMRARGMAEEAESAFERLVGPVENNGDRILSTNQFETAVSAARVAGALGKRGEADGLLCSAEAFFHGRRTGDARAPGMLLAEARGELGGTPDAVKQAWLDGLDRAGDRPGFCRSVAVALTVGGMAASPCAWTPEEVRKICDAASGIATAQK